MKRLVPFWIIGGILVVGLLWGVRWYVREQANESAQQATRIANVKAARLQDGVNKALAKTQHDEQVKAHLSDLSRCARQNFTRAQINRNTRNQAKTLHLLYLSRHGAVLAEGIDTAVGKNDARAAASFVAQRKALVYLKPLDCHLLYPDPFAAPQHR